MNIGKAKIKEITSVDGTKLPSQDVRCWSLPGVNRTWAERPDSVAFDPERFIAAGGMLDNTVQASYIAGL